MSYTVGLDFGTHQTKVCIQDASNPAQKLYEFLEFKDNTGRKTVLFPSILQINEDDTVSYGFIDDSKCKMINKDGIVKPKLNLTQRPVLELPKEPHKPIFPAKPKLAILTWIEKLQHFFNNKEQKVNPDISRWEETCSNLQNEYEHDQNQWEIKCKILHNNHEKELQGWNTYKKTREEEYYKATEEWNKKPIEKLHFSYFKLATFTNSMKWSNEIRPEIITVWYISYILFILQEKLSEEFFVQMGIPSGINEIILKNQEKKAFAILIAAHKLLELYKTKNSFLSEKYTNLLGKTDLNYNYSKDDLNFYGLNVMPEAYAGLSSITQQQRLETGMSLLVDIGGGTTDIAFFTITDNQPDIHAVISFPKGLNFVFEKYIHQNGRYSIIDIQEMFFMKSGDKLIFNGAINEYKSELLTEVQKIIDRIRLSFEARRIHHNHPTSRLLDALKNRPAVFCGGGAIYESMQTTLLNFTDIKLISKSLLNIPFIINQNIEDKLFTILATSYGLSIPLENEIVLTPIEKVFNHLDAPETTDFDYKYDHGLSDY